MTVLSIEDLHAGYDREPVISGISLSVPKGAFFGILGPNGAGKTTLFKVISRLIRPFSGVIRYAGVDITDITRKEYARQIAVIPQFQHILPPYTVEEFVRLGRYPHVKRFSPLRKKDCEITREILDLLRLGEYRTKKITALSGGELQRVFLAQGLAQKPSLILMDEPTSHLDIAHQIKILDIVKKLSVSTGLTVLIILHDLNLAGAYCDRIVLMREGEIGAEGTPERVLTAENIEKIYKTRVVVEKDPVGSRPHIFFIPGQH